MPKISVIVPVYKVEPFLNHCIDSILSQSHTDLEVILVDDGSPDDCPQICDNYARQDPRVIVIHKENGGLSSARNVGLDIATGEYIAFVDSDDWIDPDMYSSLVHLAQEHDADIVQGEYRFYRPWKTDYQVLDCANTGAINCYSNIDALNVLYFGPQMFGGLTIMVWTKLYRASLLKNIRFHNGYLHEDVEFTPRTLFAANKIVKIDKSFYNYNIHLGSESTSGMTLSAHKIASIVYMRKCVSDFFDEHYVIAVSEYTKRAYYDSLMNAYYESCIRSRKSLDYKRIRIELSAELENKKREMLTSGNWKDKLFFFSHFIYCAAVFSVRTIKSIKYKLSVFFTGKK